MDSHITTLAELELDLIFFEGRFTISAPPSPAPPSVLASPEFVNPDALPLQLYLLHAAPPPLDKAPSSTNSSPAPTWTDVEKENANKENLLFGSFVDSEDKEKTWPSCMLFSPVRARPSIRSPKRKPTSLPREAFSSRPGSRNHSPHPSSPLSPRFSGRI
ncbi:hypothetical protein BDZ89DRAFT_1057924 [Hymenopellis radicata]|nr:hypothetical protein BDZ89DRAFT_1057924 [Hymenopellis radicata]